MTKCHKYHALVSSSTYYFVTDLSYFFQFSEIFSKTKWSAERQAFTNY